MTKEEMKEYNRAYYETHKEERKANSKAYRQAHKEEYNTYQKAYYEAHKEEYIAYQKAYNKADTNSQGRTKVNIRVQSRQYLFNTLNHSKLKGYEIHHCFGYENHKCFIYISKELHLQIHQFLRDNGISADSNHFSQIVHLINAWEGYTYIKV